MLAEQRVKEAEANYKSYLDDGLIWKIENIRDEVLETYGRNYKESLKVAEKLLTDDLSYLWVVVTSYYSMFYIANAVLYSLGYRVGSKISHKVTSDTLIVLIRDRIRNNLTKEYEDAKEEALELIGQKTDEIISSYDKELDKRAAFQYKTTEVVKKAKAKTSYERAKGFVFEMRKLLQDKKNL